MEPPESQIAEPEALQASEAAGQEQAKDALSEIADREGFRATGDPALQGEEADRGRFKLLDYTQLYELWERQQWATQDLDFSQDRVDWHERISEEERFQRMFGLSSFFIGEQRVTEELGPIMRAAPTEEQRIFLSTQIADEARHVRFFNRFYSEVGVLEGVDGLAERLRATEEHTNEAFARLFDEMLHDRVDRLAAEPEDTVALVEAITLYHMVIEGVLALTGQHFIMRYNEQIGTLPGFVEGFGKVARDEHRHVAFGARFLTEMAATDERYREAIQAMMAEALPVADRVLDPPWAGEDEEWEAFGANKAETHAFAAQCLNRRLKIIGLAA
jgi:ribonucleoside-diphosphate reductase beta chain